MNIPLFKVFMSPTAGEEVNKVLYSGYIGQGKKVDEFEDKLINFFLRENVLTLNSGTSAIHLAIHLLKKPAKHSIPFDGIGSVEHYWDGLKEGDEMLTTPLTCTASNFPAVVNGLKIKWVDIDPDTLNMDLDDLERKITPKTKVIMVVHWGGYPNDLDRIKRIQNRAKEIHGFAPVVIEDCAHSFGSRYKGSYVGCYGNISAFSLQAIKHITSIDGGILMLPHKEIYDRAKLLRWYGIDRNDNREDFRCEKDIKEVGFKFHMNDVCATVGIENLKHADEIISKHRANAMYYDENLSSPGIKLLKREDGYDSAFWIYSMLVARKKDFIKYMKGKGIAVSQVHERNDKHSCMSEYRRLLPNLDKTIGSVVSIPVHWGVSKEEREYITETINAGW